jgi:predicted GTPase
LDGVQVALVVTSAKSGPTEWDHQIAKYILKKNIPTIHILNKCDNLPDSEEEEESLKNSVKFIYSNFNRTMLELVLQYSFLVKEIMDSSNCTTV